MLNKVLVNALAEAIIEGNEYHEEFLKLEVGHDPNLTLPAAIRAANNQMPKLTEWKWLTENGNLLKNMKEHLKECIESWKECKPDGIATDDPSALLFGILICAERTVLIMYNERRKTLSLIDSHAHESLHCGATVITCDEDDIDNFVYLYNKMIEAETFRKVETYELDFLYFDQSVKRQQIKQIEVDDQISQNFQNENHPSTFQITNTSAQRGLADLNSGKYSQVDISTQSQFDKSNQSNRPLGKTRPQSNENLNQMLIKRRRTNSWNNDYDDSFGVLERNHSPIRSEPSPNARCTGYISNAIIKEEKEKGNGKSQSSNQRESTPNSNAQSQQLRNPNPQVPERSMISSQRSNVTVNSQQPRRPHSLCRCNDMAFHGNCPFHAINVNEIRQPNIPLQPGLLLGEMIQEIAAPVTNLCGKICSSVAGYAGFKK